MAPDAYHRYYERYWSAGGYQPVGYDPAPEFTAVLERCVTPGSSVVDVGCGDGSKIGGWVQRRKAEYLGLDISAVAVERARELGYQAERIEDASRLPVADGSADVVVSTEVLEHLFDPLDAVTEMARVARPGGMLLITVPNIAHWRNRADMAFGRWHPGGDDLSVQEPWRDPHIRFFTRSSLRRMLMTASLEVLEVNAFSEAGVVARVPGLRRLGGAGPPGPVSRSLVAQAPTLFGARLYAVAQTHV